MFLFTDCARLVRDQIDIERVSGKSTLMRLRDWHSVSSLYQMRMACDHALHRALTSCITFLPQLGHAAAVLTFLMEQNMPSDGSKLKRRSFLARIIFTLMGPITLTRKPVYGATRRELDQELAPFRKIAADKQFKFTFRPGTRPARAPTREMHLDMDMVRASLNNAIERARSQRLTKIEERLQRLLTNGTAAQQVDFVLGSGTRYFFPGGH